MFLIVQSVDVSMRRLFWLLTLIGASSLLSLSPVFAASVLQEKDQPKKAANQAGIAKDSGSGGGAGHKKWQGYIELLGKSGSKRTLGQADLFVPIMQDNDSLAFFNLRGQLDNKSNDEFNIGFGFRQLCSNWILGGYAYFDRRSTSNNNTFTQGSVGFEALSNTWDFRANGYIPEPDTKRIKSLDTVAVLDSSIGVRLGQERALPGFDAEVGYKLPFLGDARIYAGGYHFDAKGFDNISGPRGRFEMRFHDLPFLSKGSRLTLGVEVTHDDARDTQAFGLVQLRIPFGIGRRKTSRTLTSLERRMTDPVIKDVDIISSVSLGNSIAARFSSGTAISSIVTVNASDNANDNVATKITNAGANSIVVVDGAVETAGITLQSGQMLTGGGGAPMTLYFISNEGTGLDESISYTLPDAQAATITGTGEDVITVAAGDSNNRAFNVIQNLTISGGTGDGITTAPSLTPTDSSNAILDGANIQLIGSTITDVGAHGIELDDDSILIVKNSEINNTGARAIITGDSNTLNFNEFMITNTGAGAIRVQSSNTLNFNTVTLADSGSWSIQAQDSNTLIFNDVMINRGSRGIVVDDENSGTFTRVAINSPGGRGISFDNDNDFTLNDITIQDVASGNEGLTADDRNTLAITNLTVSGVVDSNALRFSDGNTLTITNLDVSGVENGNALEFRNDNTTTITDLMISDTSGVGINIASTTIRDDDNNITGGGNNVISIRDGIIEGIVSSSTMLPTSDHAIDVASAPDGLAGAANELTLTNVTINNGGDRGIYIRNRNTLNLTDVTINRARYRGIDVDSENSGTFTRVTVIGTLQDRDIQFDNDNNFILSDITIQSAGDPDHSLRTYDRNTFTIMNLNVSGVVNSNALLFDDGNIVNISDSVFGNLSAGRFAIEVDRGNVISGSGNRIVVPSGDTFDGNANVCDIDTSTNADFPSASSGEISFADFDGAGTPGVCAP